MLQTTDRLRILCLVVGLSKEDLARRLAASSSKKDKKESVSDWWEHKRQPKKNGPALVQILQAAVDENELGLDVANLWTADLTLAALAEACGKSIHHVMPVLSESCKRQVFEETDRHPPLRQIREEFLKHAALWTSRQNDIAGTYFLYRIHSSDRRLCQEVVSIAPNPSGYFLTGRYYQYAEGGRQRPIDLSIFALEGFIHAVGAYSDSKANGEAQQSIVHALVMQTPYRRVIVPGLMMGSVDVGTYACSQRILMRKVAKTPVADPAIAEAVRERGRYKRYRDFLQIGDDEQVMLNASLERITRFLERRRPRT